MFWSRKKVNNVLAEGREGTNRSLGWRGTGNVHKQACRFFNPNAFRMQKLFKALLFLVILSTFAYMTSLEHSAVMTLPESLIASTLKQLVFLPFGQSGVPDLSNPVSLRPAAGELASGTNIYINTAPTSGEIGFKPFQNTGRITCKQAIQLFNWSNIPLFSKQNLKGIRVSTGHTVTISALQCARERVRRPISSFFK